MLGNNSVVEGFPLSSASYARSKLASDLLQRRCKVELQRAPLACLPACQSQTQRRVAHVPIAKIAGGFLVSQFASFRRADSIKFGLCDSLFIAAERSYVTHLCRRPPSRRQPAATLVLPPLPPPISDGGEGHQAPRAEQLACRQPARGESFRPHFRRSSNRKRQQQQTLVFGRRRAAVKAASV